MFNLDNLPGVISTLNDYNLGNIQDDTSATTESVLILGTAIDGPKGIVATIRSISDAVALYGDFKDASGNPNGATLVRGIMEAYKAGCRDIRAMRITGKLAYKSKVDDKGNPNDATLTNADLYDLAIEARYEGDVYNSIYVTFDHTAGVLTINKPANKLTDYEKKSSVAVSGSTLVASTYKYSDFGLTAASPLADLIRNVNNQASNNVVTFKIVDNAGNDITTSLDPAARALKISDIKDKEGATIIPYKLSGGSNEIGIDDVELYKRLGGFVNNYTLGVDGVVSVNAIDTTTLTGYENSIYELLANYRVDNVVLMDGQADVDLTIFKDVNGVPKTSVTADEFMALTKTGRPYVNVKTTADIKNSVGATIVKANGTVARFYLRVDPTETATTTLEIKAASATPSITLDNTGGVNTFVITPKTGADSLKDIYAQIQTSTETLTYNTKTFYPKDMIYVGLFYSETYLTAPTVQAETDAVFTGATVQGTVDNFARQLAQACAIISSKNNECIGVIGCASAPGVDLLTVKNYINGLLGRKDSKSDPIHVAYTYDLYLKNAEGGKLANDAGKPIDIGGYISIVASPDLVFADGVLGSYASNGVAAYAGLISTLDAEYSTTNRPVNGAVLLRYELSGQQLNDLTGSGYVTFKNNYGSGIVVTDGVTAASPSSDFQRLTTKRITNAAMHVVRRVCEPFIGLPNSLAQRNALSTAIQAGLDGMKQAGAIQEASFEVYSSKKDQVLGNALIDLTIVPTFEFRKIRVYVNLKTPS